ncbi:MAG TPA: serine/threonine-protein kinase [Polyangiaceae bacterium]|jgi:serine/threonine-protein kinase|nr:serine/threonine-protein kinase [Polyangiaceae bacterium]
MPEPGTATDSSHLDPAGRRIGTVLDSKWKLDSLLGVGGMAAVYAATHRNGARAAIKLFPFSVTTSLEFAERILREGYLANKIGHPAVVRVLDDHLDRDAEYAYLVMELLEGETARQRVERTGPMSPIDAARSMIELVNCLAVAHDRGVVHRDIKPENLFLTDDGVLKVLDFGVARALDGTSSSVTRTGAMLGTPAYMSPEQARGRPSEVSARSDLYSAGATLLFLVAGEFLHEGESAQEIMVRAAWTPAKKIGERKLGLPESIANVIDGACAFEPSERFQTAAEMRAALESTLMELANDPTASEPVARFTKRTMRGPISTAPLPLSTPRDHLNETLYEATSEPPVGATLTVASRKSRRRTYSILAAASVMFFATLFVFLSRGTTEKPKDAVPTKAAGTPTAMPPGNPPPEAAPAPTLEQVPVMTAPTTLPSAQMPAARPVSGSHHALHASIAPRPASKPQVSTSFPPAPQPAAATATPKSSRDRDIGY